MVSSAAKKAKLRYAIPESDKDLSGKTIVFTGGTDGMGREAVEMLYEIGASVVLLGRNNPKGEAVVRELTAAGGLGAVIIQVCDLYPGVLQHYSVYSDGIMASDSVASYL